MIKRLKKFLLLCSAMFLITSCSIEGKPKLRISISPWPGYMPMIYAYEKGWLKDVEFRPLWTVSLDESVKLYDARLVDGFFATQFEYLATNEKDLKPIFFTNLSNGSDVIMSNVDIGELKNKNSITAYLEPQSVNMALLDSFCDKYGIDKNKIDKQYKNQQTISDINSSGAKAVVIATYEPYASKLEKSGFKRIASTKDLNLRVVDALFVSNEQIKEYKDELSTLKNANDKAVGALKSNPREFYETVKKYLQGQSYEDFVKSLDGIVWIDPANMDFAIRDMELKKISTDEIVK